MGWDAPCTVLLRGRRRGVNKRLCRYTDSVFMGDIRALTSQQMEEYARALQSRQQARAYDSDETCLRAHVVSRDPRSHSRIEARAGRERPPPSDLNDVSTGSVGEGGRRKNPKFTKITTVTTTTAGRPGGLV